MSLIDDSIETCPEGNHAPKIVLQGLPERQGYPCRHRCAVCAYEAGRQDGRSGKFGEEMAGVGKRPKGFHICKHRSKGPLTTLETLHENQSGDARHKCCNCAYQVGFADGQREMRPVSDFDAQAQDTLETEIFTHGGEVDDYVPLPEGRQIIRQHISYERDRRNRAKALKYHGTRCAACGFDFDEVYGSNLAKGYIEIHHVTSIAEQAGRPVDARTDLVPLCSNCHSMAHRETGRILSVSELNGLLTKRKS